MSTQNLQALAVGNEVRLQCSSAKARVHSAPDTAAGMAILARELEDRPRWPKDLTVAQTLRWPRRSTPRHRRALLAHAGCSQQTTVAKLTERQRVVLCHALRSPVVWRGRA